MGNEKGRRLTLEEESSTEVEADIVVEERDIGMAERGVGAAAAEGAGAEAGVGAAEGGMLAGSKVDDAVLIGSGAGALAVRVGTTACAPVDALTAPDSKLTSLATTSFFPPKNSAALRLGSAESAGG